VRQTWTPDRPPVPAPGGNQPGRANRDRRTTGLNVRVTAGGYVLAVLALVVSALSMPTVVSGRSPAAYFAAAVAGAALLLISLILHEAGHALAARRHGCTVDQISVGFGGGTRHGMYELPGPRGQWRVAAAGPLVSLILAVLAVAAAAGLNALNIDSLAALVLFWIGIANAAYGVLNLLPGAGPDGGRIVRAVTWARTGNPAKAGLTAARAGQVTGAVLAAAGLAVIAGGYTAGLWPGLIGILAFVTSRSQARQLQTAETLAGLRVADVALLDTPPGEAKGGVQAWQTVAAFAATHPVGGTAFPLRDFDGQAAGLLTLSQLAAVPMDQQESVRLRDVATPIAHVATTTPDEQLTSLLQRLQGWPRVPAAVHTAGHALVLDANRVAIGVLTPADLVRASQLGTLRRRQDADASQGAQGPLRLWAPWSSRSGSGPPPSGPCS
jgi:Zn-dependent protease